MAEARYGGELPLLPPEPPIIALSVRFARDNSGYPRATRTHLGASNRNVGML
jgi:hypothetical protein